MHEQSAVLSRENGLCGLGVVQHGSGLLPCDKAFMLAPTATKQASRAASAPGQAQRRFGPGTNASRLACFVSNYRNR